jgi:energy-coupling factor transporter ATP-binding protein EcfA2
LTFTAEVVDGDFNDDTRDESAVCHLTFTVESRATVALIGESGCGKSTTLQLPQCFSGGQEGKILVDGADNKSLSEVRQGPFLFSISTVDTIRFAKRDATTDESCPRVVRRPRFHYGASRGPEHVGDGKHPLRGKKRGRLDEVTVPLGTEEGCRSPSKSSRTVRQRSSSPTASRRSATPIVSSSASMGTSRKSELTNSSSRQTVNISSFADV